MIIKGRNVNHLYLRGINFIRSNGVLDHSRNGDVLAAGTPVLSVYDRPTERVLFDTGRRANPFFHLFESLWMLAGRDDVSPLLHYVGDFDKFAEADGKLHGAYGARWRWKLGRDQLEEAITYLSKNPVDRRVVISMWQQDCDLGATYKDIPCNTQIYLRVHKGQLDLTVTCRSNDLIWGAYGANAVHFSVLQEYLASRIGVAVGQFYQFSNNYHAYLPVLEKVGVPQPILMTDKYTSQPDLMRPRAIGDVWHDKVWDEDLAAFLDWHEALWEHGPAVVEFSRRGNYYKNQWFWEVPSQMALAMFFHRHKDDGQAHLHAANIRAADWCTASVSWLKNTPISRY